jgi:hypothetical protein
VDPIVQGKPRGTAAGTRAPHDRFAVDIKRTDECLRCGSLNYPGLLLTSAWPRKQASGFDRERPRAL